MSTSLNSKLVVVTGYITHVVKKKNKYIIIRNKIQYYSDTKSTTMDMNLYNFSLKINHLNTS